MVSFEKCFHLVYWPSYGVLWSVFHLSIGHMVSFEKCFQLVCWPSYGVLWKVFPFSLLAIIWRPLKRASGFSIGRCMASLASAFYLSIGRRIYDVLGKVLSICLLADVYMTSLAKCFPSVYLPSYGVLGKWPTYLPTSSYSSLETECCVTIPDTNGRYYYYYYYEHFGRPI